MPTRIALVRCSVGSSGGGQADDDGVVAGQHQVDHHDLEESEHSCRVKNSIMTGGLTISSRHRSLAAARGPGLAVGLGVSFLPQFE